MFDIHRFIELQNTLGASTALPRRCRPLLTAWQTTVTRNCSRQPCLRCVPSMHLHIAKQGMNVCRSSRAISGTGQEGARPVDTDRKRCDYLLDNFSKPTCFAEGRRDRRHAVTVQVSFISCLQAFTYSPMTGSSCWTCKPVCTKAHSQRWRCVSRQRNSNAF